MPRKKPSGVRHDNYELLNIIGYGLAKFEGDLIAVLGFQTKSALYRSLIARGVANTVGTLKNRQDLFNPLVRKEKVGWWQNQDRYLHRKLLLDSLFGTLDAVAYGSLVQYYLHAQFPAVDDNPISVAPILKSKFRQLQETGSEAELYFLHCYRTITRFQDGVLEDARLFGDGYDFQIAFPRSYFLVEAKGVRGKSGGIRLTENEFEKAKEFTTDYCVVVVSQLETSPHISLFFDPLKLIPFRRQTVASEQLCYVSSSRTW